MKPCEALVRRSNRCSRPATALVLYGARAGKSADDAYGRTMCTAHAHEAERLNAHISADSRVSHKIKEVVWFKDCAAWGA